MTTTAHSPAAGWQPRLRDLLENAAGPASDEQTVRALRVLGADRVDSFCARQMEAFSRSGSEERALALGSGELRIQGFPPVQVSEGGIWANLSGRNRSWLWHVQQFWFLKDAIRAYQTSGKVECVDVVVQCIDEWMLAYLRPESVEAHKATLAWHDHATAQRASIALLYWALLHRSGRATNERLTALLKFFEVHVELLQLDDFYSRNTNHGFDQAFALFWTCSAVDLGDVSERGRRLAQERLSGEIRFAFDEQGVHVENSPGYHLAMMGRLVAVKELLGAYGVVLNELNVEDILNRALVFLTHALKPNGELPTVGDSQRVAPSPTSFKELADLPNFQQWQYSVTKGRKGQRPGPTTTVFKNSGYVVLRDAWRAPDDFEQGTYVLFKCGLVSHYHRHDDDNSFVLYSAGEDWLVDSGLYSHHETEPMRVYMRCARAHNVASVKGAETHRRPPESRGGWGLRRWSTRDGVSEVVGLSRMFAGFLYTRILRFDRQAHRIEVFDEIKPEVPSEYQFQLLFHFAPDKQVSLEDGMAVIRSEKTGAEMRLQFDPQVFPVRQIEVGVDGPDRVGWFSGRLGQVEAIPTLILETAPRPKLESSVRIDLERSRTNHAALELESTLEAPRGTAND